MSAEMTVAEVEAVLAKCRGASAKGVEDGTRLHMQYKAFGSPTAAAEAEAGRAAELELPRDRFTGRLSKVWRSAANDLIVTMYVELERDHKYRSFNASRGAVRKLVVLGD